MDGAGIGTEALAARGLPEELPAEQRASGRTRRPRRRRLPEAARSDPDSGCEAALSPSAAASFSPSLCRTIGEHYRTPIKPKIPLSKVKGRGTTSQSRVETENVPLVKRYVCRCFNAMCTLKKLAKCKIWYFHGNSRVVSACAIF